MALERRMRSDREGDGARIASRRKYVPHHPRATKLMPPAHVSRPWRATAHQVRAADAAATVAQRRRLGLRRAQMAPARKRSSPSLKAAGRADDRRARAHDE